MVSQLGTGIDKEAPSRNNTGMSNDNPSPETRFQPGVSGNPAGKPVGAKNLSTLLREALAKIVKNAEGEDTTYEVLLIKRVMKKAIEQGDMRAVELIWAYLEGKPKERKIVELDLPQNLIDLIKHGSNPTTQQGGSESIPAENKG